METLLLDAGRESDIKAAAELLRNGGVVGIPTETVYGLAANAFDGVAVAKIFEAKQRPMDNPLIVHISDFSDIYELVSEVPDSAKKLADAFWPGPLTIILPKSDRIPDEVSAGLDTVAVRFPSNTTAQRIISECGFPLAAPSANLSGRPSPTSASHVMEDLGGRIDAVVDGGVCDVGLESTVITLALETPHLLRPGRVTPEEIEHVIGHIEVDDAVLHPLADGAEARSPGMKHKHYSPKAEVIIVDGDTEVFADYVNGHAESGDAALCYVGDGERLCVPYISYGREGDSVELAHELFEALRELDEKLCAKRVFARCPQPEGVGLAVYNRMIRAAGFRVIKP